VEFDIIACLFLQSYVMSFLTQCMNIEKRIVEKETIYILILIFCLIRQ